VELVMRVLVQPESSTACSEEEGGTKILAVMFE
jgi:hypothetical protein